LRQYSFVKKIQSQNVSIKKLEKTLVYKKGRSKMLMKLTPLSFPSEKQSLRE